MGGSNMAKNKKKKKRTIGEMTNSRKMWERKPQTQVVENKRRKNDRKKIKERIKMGCYDV
jgi:hypothetical protein